MTVRRYSLKGKPAWGYDFRHGGVRYRRCDAGWRKVDAEREERRAHDAAEAGTNPAANAPATLADLCHRWLEAVAGDRSAKHLSTCRQRVAVLVRIAPVAMRQPPMRVSPIHIEAVKRALREHPERHTPLSNTTIRAYLALLAAALNWGAARGWAPPANPCRSVARPRANPARQRYLSPDEAAAVVAAMPEGAPRAFVALALNTGLRRGELTELRWADVDQNARRLYVRTSKTGEGRGVPLNEAALSALAALPVGPGLVFPGRGGRPLANGYRKSFEAALARIGLVDVRFHDLRHTFASHMVGAGVPLGTVAQLMGHTTTAMTMRYAHLAPDVADAAVAALGVRLGSGGQVVGKPAGAALRLVG
jgi:integrase